MILFRKVSFWLALAGVASAGLLIHQLRAQLHEPVPPPPVTPPTKPFPDAVGAAGLVEALGENTAVGVPAPALVAAVHVRVWDRVEAGQPLLQLDDRDVRARLATLQSEVAVAEASLARLAGQVSRLEAVSDPRAISREELLQRRSDVAVARAQLEAARAAVAQQEVLLDRLVVRAPRDGTILQVSTRAGEYAAPGAATPPILLGYLDSVQIRADVDEQLAPRIRPGARAIGRVKGAAETPIALEFARIEPAIVPKRSLTGASNERVDTRVLQVLFTCPNTPEHPLYVGQQIDLFIEALPQ
jgi:RND family efflux transporter MFP subunit